jgi:hypothetical protein
MPTKIKVPKRVEPHSYFWGLFVERQRDRSFPERFFCEGSVVSGRDDFSFDELDDSFGTRTWDRAKAEPGLVKKIADPAIFNQSSEKIV